MPILPKPTAMRLFLLPLKIASWNQCLCAYCARRLNTEKSVNTYIKYLYKNQFESLSLWVVVGCCSWGIFLFSSFFRCWSSSFIGTFSYINVTSTYNHVFLLNVFLALKETSILVRLRGLRDAGPPTFCYFISCLGYFFFLWGWGDGKGRWRIFCLAVGVLFWLEWKKLISLCTYLSMRRGVSAFKNLFKQ